MSRVTQEQKHKSNIYFTYGTVTLFGVAFQQLQLYMLFVTFAVQVQRFCPTTPYVRRHKVWALPFSLAATKGITRVAFHRYEASHRRKTTRYCSLFLSVLRCFTSRGSHLLYTKKISAAAERFPYSEISGSRATYRLPGAYR